MVPTSLLGSRALGVPEFSFDQTEAQAALCAHGPWVSTEKRSLYDNSFRLKIVFTRPCKNRKQNVSCSWSHQLILWVPPQVKRGGCMQGNGLEKELCAQLPLLVLFRVSDEGE